METLNIQYCPNCNEKFTEVYMLPCMHNFCNNCTDLMKKKAEPTCLICSSQFHQDEVKRNTFLEKVCSIDFQSKKNEVEVIICELCDSDSSENQAENYCIDCSQYICSKCTATHARIKLLKDHKIVDKNKVESLIFKSPEPNCDKHKQSLTIYCKKCNVLLCATCCIMYHSDHDKSDNLGEVFKKSNSDIQKKIIELDDIIKNQNNMISENKAFETVFIQNCDKVRNEIEGFAKELKDLIDNLTKVNVTKINDIKNNFIKSIQDNLKDVTNYISSLTNLKSYFQEVVIKGSNVDVFNSTNELNKNTWIETKKPKVITKMILSFEKLSIDKLILTDLSSSLKLSTIKELKIMLKTSPTSVCVFKKNIYTTNYIYDTISEIDQNFCIDVYNIETGKYQTTIEYEQYLGKDISFVLNCNTQNDFFLYYYCNISGYTYLLKLKDDNTFVQVKMLDYFCNITSTFQQTLLVRSEHNQLIELSSNGDVLKNLFTIPSDAIFLYYAFYIYNKVYQLINKQYVMASFNNNLIRVSLLDSKGTLIKFIIRRSTNCEIRICTDGKKYIFLLESNVGHITVLSTDMNFNFEFNYPGVENIFYDQEHDKVLLIRQNEVIYLTYPFDVPISV